MEWGRFARWLKEQRIAPEMLLRDDPARLLAGWTDRTVTLERIHALLNRAGALGLAVEKWQRAGLWILIRADADYPSRLKNICKPIHRQCCSDAATVSYWIRAGLQSSVRVTPAWRI